MKSNLASTLCDQGDLLGAKTLFEQVLVGRERTYGLDHPDTLLQKNALADTLYSLGDIAGARTLLEQVQMSLERILGNDHLDTLKVKTNVAAMLFKQGRLSDARVLLEQVLAVRERIQGVDHSDTKETRELIGIVSDAKENNVNTNEPTTIGRTAASNVARIGINYPGRFVLIDNKLNIYFDETLLGPGGFRNGFSYNVDCTVGKHYIKIEGTMISDRIELELKTSGVYVANLKWRTYPTIEFVIRELLKIA